jgi:hypothetical protein
MKTVGVRYEVITAVAERETTSDWFRTQRAAERVAVRRATDGYHSLILEHTIRNLGGAGPRRSDERVPPPPGWNRR